MPTNHPHRHKASKAKRPKRKPLVSGKGKRKTTYKYMQVLDSEIYHKLEKIAQQRGVTVQELIRVEIFPEYLGLAGIPKQPTPPPLRHLQSKPARGRK